MIKNLKNKKKKGFTLIEIIAVVAIIAILAAVLVPKVTGYIKESRKTGVTDQARKVVTAAESYKIKKNQTDTAVNALKASEVAGHVPDLLGANDYTKVGSDTTVEQCRKILDPENYTFTVTDKGVFDNVN